MPRRRLTALLVLALFHAALASTPLRIGLHPAWPPTPPAAEATLWVAQNLGPRAALRFLLALPAPPHTPDALHACFARLHADRGLRATFAWALHARRHAASAALHRALAHETLAAFGRARAVGVGGSFAVRVRGAGVGPVALVQSPDQIAADRLPEVREARSFVKWLARDVVLGGGGGGGGGGEGDTVILYIDLGGEGLVEWVAAVERLVDEGGRVVLRFWGEGGEGAGGLQGYVVQAALKKTEYTVIDDRTFETRLFVDCAYGDEECVQQGGKLREEEEEGHGEDDVVDEYAWAEDGKEEAYTGSKVMRFIGKRAAGNLREGLRVLRAFAEDAASVVRSNAFLEFTEGSEVERKRLTRTVAAFREVVGESDYLYLNGFEVDLSALTQNTEQLFDCLSGVTVARMSLRLLGKELGLSTLPSFWRREASGSNRLRVNLGLDTALPSSLVWFNDLLNDSRYKKWRQLDVGSEDDIKAFQEMEASQRDRKEPHLQLAKVKAHHLSVVILADPGDVQQMAYLSLPEQVVRAELPIRVGVALVPNGRVSSLMVASFHYFLRAKGRRTCARFIQMIRQILEYFGGGYQQVRLSEQIIHLAFSQIAGEVDGKYASPAEVLDGDDEIRKILDEARAFAERNGLLTDLEADEQPSHDGDVRKFAMLGIFNGVVMRDIPVDILSLAVAEQRRIAKLFTAAKLPGNDAKVTDFQRWVASDPELIMVEGLSKEMRSGDVRLSTYKSQGGLQRLPASGLFDLRTNLRNVDYLSAGESSGKGGESKITVWLAGTDHSDEIFRRIEAHLRELATSDFARQTRSRYAIVERGSSLHDAVLQSAAQNEACGGTVLIINGRMVPSSVVTSADQLKVEVAMGLDLQAAHEEDADLAMFRSLFEAEVSTACAAASRGQAAGTDHPKYGDVVASLSAMNHSDSVLASSPKMGAAEVPSFGALAVVDPAGKTAFIAAALLNALSDAYEDTGLEMTVAIVPSTSTMKQYVDPPSTYSKFVIGSPTSFRDGGGRASNPHSVFRRLPEKKVLTVAVEPPRAWFVSSHATNYDMDNVVLANLPKEIRTLHAEYALSNLIVEGSCIDEKEQPPQGLKLVLEDEGGTVVDTLVMANLGYFQLKVSNPGRWSLHLASGPSRDVFSLDRMEMYSGNIKTVHRADAEGRVSVLVESLSGAGGILLRVKRNPGMEGKSVLDPNKTEGAGENASITGRLKAKFADMYTGRRPQKDLNDGDRRPSVQDKQINVFSVASGHLYERFLKIMMSSVTKHASRPVKFWLLENYLSPSFKKMLPRFAKKHGFEVEMVTYKWPAWLRAQTEKQRIIWAYKILFLDVLFPLDVGRIIFVDSDQVVRGDLAELMDIDLQGAPYGYVPFCDSRKEVEGYRFWKEGFWKATLKGAKYRISALYVVDLIRFRETAAGDTLRFIYQSLSADPNSLSNLDQDLPNYASAGSPGQSVPIFDLPAEWLWCESWCDDESKKSAKAIDLCNNPMTKEPKLDSAKRIIAEWVDYDSAASELTLQIYKDLARESPMEATLGDKTHTCAAGSSSADNCSSRDSLAEDVVKTEL